MSHLLHRRELIARLHEPKDWDLAIIGGGATGLGVALDAAARGLKHGARAVEGLGQQVAARPGLARGEG